MNGRKGSGKGCETIAEMSNSVASRASTKKWNIDPSFAKSPYLSKPTGLGAKSEPSKQTRQRRRRGRDGSDAESVGSFRTFRSSSSYRTQQYRRPAQSNSSSRMASMKNFLLPREMEKLLRGFRQKHSNHPILKGRQGDGKMEDVDDNSSIASDCARSLDDKAIYLECARDEEVANGLFSGPLFAEIALRNCDRERSDGPLLNLPLVGDVMNVDHDGEVSDLDSLHSSASKLMPERKQAGRKQALARRKKR